MIEEKRFDYESYIQNKLKEIDDLDERRFAKELLLEGLRNVFSWAEHKYVALEKRVQNELDVPWKSFHVYMTIIDRADYDPINHFWFPICEEDIKKNIKRECETVYLAAGEKAYKAFNEQKILVGTDSKTGETVRFRIERSARYQQSIKMLYELFTGNYIPWQTLHLGHLERFYDLIPENGTLVDKEGREEGRGFQYGKWRIRPPCSGSSGRRQRCWCWRGPWRYPGSGSAGPCTPRRWWWDSSRWCRCPR